MKTETSCGAVVYTIDGGEIRYVIIRSKKGVYGFPKGHMEGSESESETALREIAEETGLSVRIVGGFRAEDGYKITVGGEERLKRVVYFLAEYSDQTPVPQETELSDVRLLDFETAMDLLQFDSSKRILSEAHKFLNVQKVMVK